MSFTRAGDLPGAWRLDSAAEVFDDGERRGEFGPGPEGYLCYSPAGIVSAAPGDPGRPPVPAGDPQSGTGGDYEKMARHFIAYAGPFSADAGNGTVTHHIGVSLFPNWQGHDQVRRVTIENGRLSIIASDRTAADGRTFHSELTWLKV
jgi:hypothetical protein